MNTNTKLKRLYQKYSREIREVRNEFKNVDIEGPFLLFPCNEYNNSAKKLMIIGQQTKGWNCEIENFDVQLDSYNNFDLGRTYYASPFWNIYHKIERAILENEYCSVWGNINKYDLEKDRPYGKYEEEISKLDFLLREEIKILNPDIVIFLCGYTFDQRIMSLYNELEFVPVKNWNYRELVQFKHKDLPINTYRTYHPNYLRRSKLENDIIKSISEKINT